jgi:hypothetical protein
MSTLTKREQIMNFVESQGTASFTEIQRFIVDLNMGKGTYDAAKHTDRAYSLKTETHSVKCNRWRGYYCGAFSGPNPTLLYGKKSHLIKGDNGRYSVIRYN